MTPRAVRPLRPPADIFETARLETLGGRLAWQDDVLLPWEHRALHTSSARSPEQRLCVAVIEEACDVLRLKAVLSDTMPRDGLSTQARRLGKRHRLRADTIAWFQSDDTVWPYSFVNLCDHLGLDATVMRRGLAAQGWVPGDPGGHQKAGLTRITA